MVSPAQVKQVTSLVEEVGEYIRTERITFQTSAIEHKDIHDMVSYVDKTAEKKIIEGLNKIMPGSSFTCEESGIHNNSSAYNWIIDPLDGTTNFIHNFPHYCVSVGLAVDGEIKAGWVYEICNNEMYTAIRGEGALRNGQHIEVSKSYELHQCLIATGFPVRTYDQLDQYMELLKSMIINTRGLRRLGTAAYDLCMVASGKVEAYYEPRLSAWDVAAGSIIVQEAGGMVTDFYGADKFIENASILASNSYIHNDILREIKRCMNL